MTTSRVMLIVDDSRMSRMMIRSFAKEADERLQFIEVAHGEEALGLDTDTQVDIMTVDYNMPGMDGVEVAEQLQQRYPGVQAALLTANIQESIQRRAAAAQLEFIAKPITEQKIVSFVRANLAP